MPYHIQIWSLPSLPFPLMSLSPGPTVGPAGVRGERCLQGTQPLITGSAGRRIRGLWAQQHQLRVQPERGGRGSLNHVDDLTVPSADPIMSPCPTRWVPGEAS